MAIHDELTQMFKDQFLADVETMEAYCTLLGSAPYYSEAVNHLFRTFHNQKASAGYLGFDSIFELAKNVEEVLGAMRSQNGPASLPLTEWFKRVHAQMQHWSRRFDREKRTSAFSTSARSS